MTLTDSATERGSMFLHDLFVRGGRLVISDTPLGLWYSDSYFAKPADEALRKLLARQGLELRPSAYWIDIPDDEDDDDPSEEMWVPADPDAVDLGKLFPDPDIPAVRLEPVRFDGCPALIQWHEGADLTYVFRRTDGQEVYLSRAFVRWVAGPDHTGWQCSQPETAPNTTVWFHDPAGRLAGIVMPILPKLAMPAVG
jgi:hypothetical protein